MESYDVLIIGAGPAGLTAGIYCAQAHLRVIALERASMGGRVVDTSLVENYPGFGRGISGPDLGGAMLEQALGYGMGLAMAEVTEVVADRSPIEVRTNMESYACRTLILSGGASPKTLGIPGEQELIGKGVGYCAHCDGGQFVDKSVTVVGGGNSGLTDALYLSRIASRITILEILPELRALPLLVDRIRQQSNIDVRCGVTISAIEGTQRVTGVVCSENGGAETEELSTDGVLVRIGYDPETEYLKGKVSLDPLGFVEVDLKMATSVPGVFAAGDIRAGSPMQIASAVGDGAVAAISAQAYLSERDDG